MSISSTVVEIVADILDVDLEMITEKSTQEMFEEWDSLATIQIINSVGDEFGLEIGVNDIDAFVSIKSITAFIESNK